MHRCDVRACYELAHLFLGSYADNSADMVAKSRQRRGETQPMHKLTEQQVLEIRARYAAGGITYERLAPEFGVHPQTVGPIVRRKRWKHLEEAA
jgi:hypothetical protein